MLGLLKLFIIFTLLNEWHFEKKLALRYSKLRKRTVGGGGELEENLIEKEKEIDFKEVFSYENVY